MVYPRSFQGGGVRLKTADEIGGRDASQTMLIDPPQVGSFPRFQRRAQSRERFVWLWLARTKQVSGHIQYFSSTKC